MAKKHSAIATLWANKVGNGKTYEEVPPKLKDEVKEILIERGKWVEETPEETENKSTDESNTTTSDETTKTE